MIYQAFISYNSEDKFHVELISRGLRDNARIEIFYDEWSLVPGDSWQEEIETALGASKACVIFIGAKGLGPWQREEVRTAIDRRVRDDSFRVIPVLLPLNNRPFHSNPHLPAFLQRCSWVDFREGIDDGEEFERLIKGILGNQPGATTIAREIRDRVRRASAHSLSLVSGLSAIDEYEVFSNTLLWSGLSTLAVYYTVTLGILSGNSLGSLILLPVIFFAILPVLFIFYYRKYGKQRDELLQRLARYYEDAGLEIDLSDVFKFDMGYCPDCEQISVVSRLDTRWVYIVRKAASTYLALLVVYGVLAFLQDPQESEVSWRALALYAGFVWLLREIVGLTKARFLCLLVGHEFESPDSFLYSLKRKLFGSV